VNQQRYSGPFFPADKICAVEPPSNPAGFASSSAAVAGRTQRRPYRHHLRSLAHVKLDQANGGIIRDLSEDGMSLQAVTSLRLGQQVAMRFELLNPRHRVEAIGCVAWANSLGQAGVEFLDAPASLRRILKDWIFTQLLAAANQVSWESIFAGPGAPAETRELTFSENRRPAILLDPEPMEDASLPEALPKPAPAGVTAVPALRVASLPSALPMPWWLVDGLIVTSAVLLFSVIALATTGAAPAWPIATLLLLTAAGIFAALYWFLFVFWTGATAGERLLGLAGSTDDARRAKSEEEDQPRFR
jgi:hypothetical protein